VASHVCTSHGSREGRNAYTERFVRSIKSECLAQIIPLGERHLRTAVKEYTEHYHLEWNHQELEDELVEDGFALA
jgi:putative transposase